MRRDLSGFLVMALLMAGCGNKNDIHPAADTNAPSPAAQSSAPATLPTEFKLLKGKWGRTDGDYVIEIKEIAADGRMEAGYFNPGPIHISRAMAIKESAGIKVFIELQDTGYPGCTYSLTLDTGTTQLHGQYFQAAMQQTYDVVFAKLPE